MGFLLGIGCTDIPAHAKNNNDSPIHELPRADRCSVIMLHIRELAFSLQQIVKEISRLEKPVRSTSESSEEHNLQMDQYGELQELREKESFLRTQIDLKEEQLQDCLNHASPPNQ